MEHDKETEKEAEIMYFTNSECVVYLKILEKSAFYNLLKIYYFMNQKAVQVNV